MTSRSPDPSRPTLSAACVRWMGWALLVVVASGWLALAALIVRHRVFVSDDSLSNYAHVWFIAERLRHAHRLPWAMAVLGHGKALAYPYAFVPWTGAALTWLAVGEWSVTLWLVLGAAFAVAATFTAFPELRPRRAGPPWTAAALGNPALITSLWFGQLPFLWAVGFFLSAIAAWRRGRTVGALVLLTVAQVTHPAIVAPIAALVVIGGLRWDGRPRLLLVVYAVSTMAAVPAMWVVVASPVFSDSSAADKAVNFAETLIMRLLVVLVPLLIAVLTGPGRQGADFAERQERRPVAYRPGSGVGRWARVGVAVALVGLGVGQYERIHRHFPWRAPVRQPSPAIASYVRSAGFEPGLTYRILRAADGKVGMYQLLRGGARLDGEFFPESQGRRRFTGLSDYASFLRARNVDRVIAFANYDRLVRDGNERELLATCGRLLAADGDRRPFAVYDVGPCLESQSR